MYYQPNRGASTRCALFLLFFAPLLAPPAGERGGVAAGNAATERSEEVVWTIRAPLPPPLPPKLATQAVAGSRFAACPAVWSFIVAIRDRFANSLRLRTSLRKKATPWPFSLAHPAGGAKKSKSFDLDFFICVRRTQHHLTEGQHHFEQSENIIAYSSGHKTMLCFAQMM